MSETARARVYVALTLGAALLVGAALLATGLSLGPPIGDLTRIGALSERLYGPRQAAAGLERETVVVLTPEALEAGAPPDILVFGDSFSEPRRAAAGWTNQLALRSGLTVGYVDIEGFERPLAYLRSPAFRAAPPKAIIIETVERTLFTRLGALADAAADPPCAAPGPFAALARPATAAVPAQTAFSLEGDFSGLDELMERGALGLRRRVLGGSEVLVSPLTRDDLFSSARPDQLLMLDGDVSNHRPSGYGPEALAQLEARMACALRALIAATGDRGLFVIAPDKRSVYEAFLAEDLPPRLIDFHALSARALGARAVDLRAPLREAAQGGVKDLYWPNDTHWSPSGAEIAARRVMARLFGEAG